MTISTEAANALSLSVKAQNLADDIRSQCCSKIYLAGPMSGFENFNRDKFNQAAEKLKQLGHVVLSPAILPAGLTQAEYMDICCAMVRCSTGLLMLDGWRKSEGATAEYYLAKKLGKDLFFQEDLFHLAEISAVNNC